MALSSSATSLPATDTTLLRPRFEWSIDANAVIQNREGGDDMSPDQTFLFTHLTPQVGIGFGRHRFMGGVVWYQPMNNEMTGYKVVPLAYYQYADKRFNLAIGMLPARETMPRYLRSDSLTFVQPILRGATVGYHHGANCFDAWLDWRQMQSATRREAFAAGFLYRHAFTVGRGVTLSPEVTVEYSHLAKTSSDLPDEGVNDHLVASPMVRLEAGAFNVAAGALVSFDRDRLLDNKWLTRAGLLVDAHWQWRRFAVEETLYVGKEQMPLYDRYGAELYWGDTWLHNDFYSRTDVVATIFSNTMVNVEGRLTLHASNHTTAFWQQLSARFFFDTATKHRAAPLHPRF